MSDEVVPQKLSACAREPIHIPGAIQPHGVLFALDDDTTIRMASENAPELLGCPTAEELLGRPLATVLGEGPAARVSEALTTGEDTSAGALRVDLGERGMWDAILHRSTAGPVVELERAGAEDPRAVDGLYHRVRAALAGLQAAGTMEELQEVMVEAIARISGMQKVMVYRFDEAWNGEVVAEATDGTLDPYLGLRFPSTDIPSQARALYRRNWLRLIADVTYTPARLVPELHPDTGEPLDLSGAVLRSVSPVHLEYLRNMHVGASMSVSLLEGDRLWGLVACHHAEARYVPWPVRTACEFLGQTFSVQIAALSQERRTDRALELERVQTRILERLGGRADWMVALDEASPSLHDVVEARGGALRFRGQWICSGTTPSSDTLDDLLDWLRREAPEGLVTDRLPRRWSRGAGRIARQAAGLVARPLGQGGEDWILWFRPEQVETVRWAGDPRKPAAPSGEGDGPSGEGDGPWEREEEPARRLDPRRSFETWVETVRGRSRAWSEVEVNAADSFRQRIVGIILRHAEELTRLNDELRRSNEELDAFSYIAGHDLKEPIRALRTWVDILGDDHPELAGEDALSEMRGLTERMDAMLESLLTYARAEHLDMDVRSVDLQDLLDGVLDVLDHRVQAAGAEIVVPRRLPAVQADPVRVASVLQNLLSNALKFNDNDHPRVEVTWEGGDGSPVVVRVADNGIGVADRDRERIFKLFKRLHPDSRYGGGSGAGLTIARRLVERHGGRLWLESNGDGTVFHFTLEPAG